MHSKRILGLFVAALSAVTAVEATFVDPRAAGQGGVGIQRRQEDDSSSSSSSEPTASPPPSSSPPPSTTSSSTRSTPTTAPTTSSPTTRPPSTSSPPQTSRPPSSSPPPEESQPPPTEVVETFTQTITSTGADGSQTVFTTQSTSTSIPGLAGNNNNNSQPSGMSTTTRNTVIGVVVGVGGAIILGGLAFVAWRIWGRKKAPEEHDNLMDYNSNPEKPDTGGSASGRTPFQSTLESYHAPTQVNTASNF